MHRARLVGSVACFTLGIADLIYLDTCALPPLLRIDATRTEARAASSEYFAAKAASERTVSRTEPQAITQRGARPPAAPALAASTAPVAQPPGPPLPNAVPHLPEAPRTEMLAVVLFRTARADVAGRYAAGLARAASRISGNVGTVRVHGHADARGDEEFNQRLSERRAEAVAAQLRALGVPSQRLIVAGFGSRQPAVKGTDPRSYARNRRVEIWIEKLPPQELEP